MPSQAMAPERLAAIDDYGQRRKRAIETTRHRQLLLLRPYIPPSPCHSMVNPVISALTTTLR